MKKDLKNLKILRCIARLNVGGPSFHCMWLFGMDKKFGHETRLLFGKTEENEGEIPIGNFHIPQEKLKKIPFLKRSIGVHDFFGFFYFFLNLFIFRPQILHTHASKAGMQGRLAGGVYNIYRLLTFRKGVRVYHTFHGHVFHGYFSPLKTKFYIFLERILARAFSTKIICISPKQKDEICNEYKICSPDKVTIVPLGLDLDTFSQKNLSNFTGNLRKELGLGPGTKIVANISRICPIKNHPFYIEIALAFLNKHKDEDVVFLLVGDGSTEEVNELKSLIPDEVIDKKIIFLGNRNDLPVIYSDLDLLCLTSINEGTPLSILEAMASQVPCISTDVGGVPDLIGKDRGLLANEKDEFLEKIHLILFDTKTRETIKNTAHQYIWENNSKEKLIERLNDLYQN